jgi:hypothetical protein
VLPINGCLRLAPFLNGPRASSLSLWRMTNQESLETESLDSLKNAKLVESSLMLRPTVSRLLCLGIKYPYGAYDQIFITVRRLRVCWFGALSLMRGRVCRLQLLLALASAVILESESCGTHDHILVSQIRDFSYDSQGYGGGIRPRLHTGYAKWSNSPDWTNFQANRI